MVDQLQSGGNSKRENWRSELPGAGLGVGVLDRMKEEKRKDVAWQGKCSGTVYVLENSTKFLCSEFMFIYLRNMSQISLNH